MKSGSRFQMNALCLIALVFGLAFSTSAEAGLFGRCGGGLFGRRQASCSSQSYSHQYQTASPCGQATVGYQYQSYQYQTAAPCAPCGQAAPPMPTYAPAQPQPLAPTLQSTPVGYRANPLPRMSCSDGSCRLLR